MFLRCPLWSSAHLSRVSGGCSSSLRPLEVPDRVGAGRCGPRVAGRQTLWHQRRFGRRLPRHCRVGGRLERWLPKAAAAGEAGGQGDQRAAAGGGPRRKGQPWTGRCAAGGRGERRRSVGNGCLCRPGSCCRCIPYSDVNSYLAWSLVASHAAADCSFDTIHAQMSCTTL